MAAATGIDPAILQAEGLSKEFAGFRAVNQVNLTVCRHTVHALIGPNGAGKTTCFNLLTGFLQPSSGRIRFNGRDITGRKPADIAAGGLVRSFQISSIFSNLTVLENVRVALQRRTGQSHRFWSSDRRLDALNPEAERLLREVGLEGDHSQLAGSLPYGRRRALELATTLALQPEMLLLDEPMSGLNAADIEVISRLIGRVAQGRTVLMVEHNLKVVADLSDVITVLRRGEVLAEGSYEAIASNAEVMEAYVGIDDD